MPFLRLRAKPELCGGAQLAHNLSCSDGECSSCRWLQTPCVYKPGHCEAPRQHSKGQECEVHRGALAHAHKRTGRSPHRLPCCGNPGILLAMLLEQSPVLPATMAGTRSVLPSDHGWFENDLRLTWHGPYN